MEPFEKEKDYLINWMTQIIKQNVWNIIRDHEGKDQLEVFTIQLKVKTL